MTIIQETIDVHEVPQEDLIPGVEFKKLTTHEDSRGFFREIVRSTDSLFSEGQFAQWSHSKMAQDVVKAWHFHHIQYDWWYVPLGVINTILIDHREESSTKGRKLSFYQGDDPNVCLPVCVRIPPGVLHGCRVKSNEAHLFYITSETYNPEDEGRLPFNDPQVGHEWGENALVADNDRCLFLPPHKRETLASKF